MAGSPKRVCYQCALPILEKSIVVCPRCGANDFDPRRSRPRQVIVPKPPELPYPWTQLSLDYGGTVLLSGNRGSGKSTICMTAEPSKLMSSEQENQQVASMWYRVCPDKPIPIISTVHTVEELDEDLRQLQEGELAVMDSVSQLQAGQQSGKILEGAIEHIRSVGARAIFIAQFTKDGDMLGPNMLAHLVDVYATIPDDPTGMRRLSFIKNRFGDLFTSYFAIGPRGVTEQKFRYAYSVEGSAGNYHFHLFPMSGAKMAGIYNAIKEIGGIDIMGTASAAIECPAYPNGFAEPDDVERRRKFAEDHGMRWLDPETVNELIQKRLVEKAMEEQC
jgi:hypothetical protein